MTQTHYNQFTKGVLLASFTILLGLGLNLGKDLLVELKATRMHTASHHAVSDSAHSSLAHVSRQHPKAPRRLISQGTSQKKLSHSSKHPASHRSTEKLSLRSYLANWVHLATRFSHKSNKLQRTDVSIF
jgi:hypothetical protein